MTIKQRLKVAADKCLEMKSITLPQGLLDKAEARALEIIQNLSSNDQLDGRSTWSNPALAALLYDEYLQASDIQTGKSILFESDFADFFGVVGLSQGALTKGRSILFLEDREYPPEALIEHVFLILERVNKEIGLEPTVPLTQEFKSQVLEAHCYGRDQLLFPGFQDLGVLTALAVCYSTEPKRVPTIFRKLNDDKMPSYNSLHNIKKRVSLYKELLDPFFGS